MLDRMSFIIQMIPLGGKKTRRCITGPSAARLIQIYASNRAYHVLRECLTTWSQTVRYQYTTTSWILLILLLIISWPSMMNTAFFMSYTNMAEPSSSNASTTDATAAPSLDAPPLQAPSRQKQFEKGKIVFAYEQGWSFQRIADYIG